MDSKKKKSLFWKIYFSAIIVFAILLVAGLTVYGFFLNDFEAALPEKEADKVLAESFSNRNFNVLFDSLDSEISEFEGIKDYAEYYDRTISEGELEYLSVSSGMDSEKKKYSVRCGKSKIGEFTLVPSGEKTTFGFNTWKLSELKTFADRGYTAVVHVLPESTLYINGIQADESSLALSGEIYNVYAVSGLMNPPELEVINSERKSRLVLDEETGEYSEEYQLVKALSTSSIYDGKSEISGVTVLEEGIDCPYTGHMPDGTAELTYTLCRVSGLEDIRELHTVDKSGRDSVLEEDGDGVLTEIPCYDSKLEEEYSELAINAATTYARFMTKDASINAVAKYFDTTSKIYRYISTSEVYWYTTHIGYKFENEKASEFYPLSDDAFVCRFTGTQTVNRTATISRVIELDLTLYFRKSGDSYIVYDLVTNAAPISR